MIFFDGWKHIWNINNQRKFQKLISDFVVSTVPADGLTLLTPNVQEPN